MRSGLTLFKDSLRLFLSNWKLFVSIVFLPVVLNYLLVWFEPSEESAVINTYEWMTYLVLLFFTAVIGIMMAIALIYAIKDPTISMREAYTLAYRKIVAYLLVSLGVGLVTFLGFIVFILPGIYLAVALIFSTMLVVLENYSPIKAMKASYAMVKGRWWRTLFRLFVLAFFSAIFAILVLLVSLIFVDVLPVYILSLFDILTSLIIAPISVAFIYNMYQDYKSNATLATPSVPNYTES